MGFTNKMRVIVDFGIVLFIDYFCGSGGEREKARLRCSNL